MPFVDFESEEDWVSMFYITNTPFMNVGGFDPAKPTVCILHPMFLCSFWTQNQFGDPRLDRNFNMIAFDVRVCGRSECRPSGKHDSWVEAADLAFAAQALHLPPMHLLAFEGPSVARAMRFAVLFAEKCLSLTLCNPPAPTELKWVFNAFDEILQAWCFAGDLESYEHAAMEGAKFLVGSDCDADLQDDLIAYWETYNPPGRRVGILAQMNVIMNRSPLTPEMYKSIKQPVLILHADRNELSPIKYADKLAGDLVNAEGGAVLYPVKGANGTLAIVPGHASIVNQIFAKFVARFPRVRSDLKPPELPTPQRMAIALERLAELTGDKSIAHRDPMSPLSFSCLPREVVQSQVESIKMYKKGVLKAFSPVGPDGRPIRKYSERRGEHWFYGEKDGLSYAESVMPAKERSKPTKPSVGGNVPEDNPYQMATSEPTPVDVVREGRLRRGTVSPASVEKHVIKGSMAKVISASQASPFQKFLGS